MNRQMFKAIKISFSRAGIINRDFDISQLCITEMVNRLNFYKIEDISNFLQNFTFFLNQTIIKYFMGTFVICWSGMSDSLHGLHLHNFIAKVTKLKYRNIYVYFELIQKSTSKIFIYGCFLKFKVLEIAMKWGYKIH